MSKILLSNGNIVDVDNFKVFTGNVLIQDGLIAEVSRHKITAEGITEEIDCAGFFISPGLIDAHIHIESSMLSPAEFAKNSVQHGTTTVLVDPHEIANVFGIKAVKEFMNISGKLPFNMLIAVPSCVPATDMETSGASISLEDMREIMQDPRIYGLAEMMNFPGIINGFGEARSKVDAFFDLGKIVDGHAPGVRGEALLSYISNGKADGNIRIMNDHETSQLDEALEKLAAGMYLAIRYGSASKDLDNILSGILTSGIDTSRCMLCSDDLSVHELYTDGHVDRAVRRCTSIIQDTLSLAPQEAAAMAISMASKNTAEYLSPYYRYHNLPLTGKISRGLRADIAIFESLDSLKVRDLFCGGRRIIKNTSPVYEPPKTDMQNLKDSINLRAELQPKDFSVLSINSSESVRAIDIQAGTLITGTRMVELPVKDGAVLPDPAQDTALIAVFERHNATGAHAVGFVRGMGIQAGALASTIAHDSHNLIVVGYDTSEMARLANTLAQSGGGIGVLRDSNITLLPLEIGGLMSTGRIENVAMKYDAVNAEARALGSKLASPFMTMSFLALPVIPELRLTSQGLIDVNKFEFVPLI